MIPEDLEKCYYLKCHWQKDTIPCKTLFKLFSSISIFDEFIIVELTWTARIPVKTSL
jgi:hypothetical protein